MAKIGEYKKHQNELPYSVVPGIKGSAQIYNEWIEENSVERRALARKNAIAAVTQVWGNHLDFKAGTWAPPITKQEVVIKDTSIITRIYNWFLNINY